MQISHLFTPKKWRKKVNYDRKQISERVKLRRQEKSDDEHLYDTSFLDGDDCDEFIDIPDMLQKEGNEKEVKQKKGLKILAQNKLLTRFPMLLAQT